MSQLLIPIVAVIIFFIIVSALQKRKKSSCSEIVVEYGNAFKFLVFLCCFSSIIFPMAMKFQENNSVQRYSEIEYLFAVIFFLFLAVYMFLEFYFVRIEVKGCVVVHNTPWRKNISFKFEEIKQVDFSHVLKCYKIRTKSQGIISIYIFMDNVPDFLDLISERTNINIRRYN